MVTLVVGDSYVWAAENMRGKTESSNAESVSADERGGGALARRDANSHGSLREAAKLPAEAAGDRKSVV